MSVRAGFGVGRRVWLVLAVVASALMFAAGLLGLPQGASPAAAAPTGTVKVDPTFARVPGVDGQVFAVVPLAGGKTLIGGKFTFVNGTPRAGIARLNADGSLDATFNPGNGFTGGQGEVHALALQPDGKVIAGGNFDAFNGAARKGIARLLTSGALDTTFTVGSGFAVGDAWRNRDRVQAVAVQSDGKVLVGGAFDSYNGVARRSLVRLNANGSLDAAYNPTLETQYLGASAQVDTTVVQPDGKVFIGGVFTLVNGVRRAGLARLNSNGSLDQTFTPPWDGATIKSVALSPDGKVVVGASSVWWGNADQSTRQSNVVRLNSNGTLDGSFDHRAGITGWVTSVALQGDGKMLVSGYFTSFDVPSPLGFTSTPRDGIARLNTNGTLDLGFNPGTGFQQGRANAVAVRSDGVLIAGGYFSTYNGAGRPAVAWINPNGSVNPARTIVGASTGVDGDVNTMEQQPDGKVLIAGGFTTVNGEARPGVARLNADGALDSTFIPPAGVDGRTVSTFAVQPDGKIIIGGNLTQVAGIARSGIARLNPNGTLDTTFNPGTGLLSDNHGQPVPGFAAAILVQPDGKIVIGGRFNTYNGAPRTSIVRANPNGTLDTTFTPGKGFSDGGYYTPAVRTLTLQKDGKILATGGFGAFNGTPRNRIARLNRDGTLDTGFSPTIVDSAGNTYYGGSIDSLVLQPDAKIIVGGSFDTVNSVKRPGLARLNADGRLDGSFVPPASLTSIVGSVLALQPDGKVLVAQTQRPATPGPGGTALVRLNSNGSADTTFSTGTGFGPCCSPGGGDIGHPAGPVAVSGGGFDNGYPTAIIRQLDGKILVAGTFTSYDDSTPGVRGITRLIPPTSAADAPFGLVATPGNASASIAFKAPINTGGLPIITYQYSLDNGATWKFRSTNSAATPMIITGLTNGRLYQVKIRAVNAKGAGLASTTVPVIPTPSVADAPLGVVATPRNGAASIAFRAPLNTGGLPILTYQYSLDNGATWKFRSTNSAASPMIITGLTNGRLYQVRIRAINAKGAGLPSTTVPVTPTPTVPDAPSGLVATPGNTRASIAFRAPLDTGGLPIITYQYSLDNGATWKFRSTNSAATPMIITGLTNGRLYQVRIRAINAKGAGLPSTTVPVTPTPTVSDAPSGLVATPGNARASIAFKAPIDTGGLPIITYQYSLDNGATWKFRSTNSAATPMIITGLTNGRLYQVRIRAINAKGAGLPSTTVPVTPRA